MKRLTLHLALILSLIVAFATPDFAVKNAVKQLPPRSHSVSHSFKERLHKAAKWLKAASVKAYWKTNEAAKRSYFWLVAAIGSMLMVIVESFKIKQLIPKDNDPIAYGVGLIIASPLIALHLAILNILLFLAFIFIIIFVIHYSIAT